MIPRKVPKLGPLQRQIIQQYQAQTAKDAMAAETLSNSIHFPLPRQPNQPRRTPGQPDVKLAAAILELAEGRGAVRVPKDVIGLHLDFAKAQYAGHMGARKFAQLNLARMKFHNPHLDVKVFRRPWVGKKVQKTYPCTATVLKANGAKEVINMQGKRSMRIYHEIMKAIRAVDLKEEFGLGKEQAEVMAKPYLNWI